jgi:hypothetical protein
VAIVTVSHSLLSISFSWSGAFSFSLGILTCFHDSFFSSYSVSSSNGKENAAPITGVGRGWVTIVTVSHSWVLHFHQLICN